MAIIGFSLRVHTGTPQWCREERVLGAGARRCQFMILLSNIALPGGFKFCNERAYKIAPEKAHTLWSCLASDVGRGHAPNRAPHGRNGSHYWHYNRRYLQVAEAGRSRRRVRFGLRVDRLFVPYLNRQLRTTCQYAYAD